MPKRKGTRGAGSVYEYPKGSGRWFAKVADGRGGYRRVRATTRAKAEEKKVALLASIAAKKQQRLHPRGGEQKLETFVNAEWWPAQHTKKLAPLTLEDYKRTVTRYLLPDWGHMPLDAFDVTLTLEIFATLRDEYSEAIAHRALTKLHSILEAAKRRRYLSYNAVDDARADLAKYEPSKAVPLTPAETERLFAAVEGHRLSVLYHIAITLGLRVGELLGLQWGDMDWTARTLTVRRQSQEVAGKKQIRDKTKTDAGARTIPIPPVLLGRLRSLWEQKADSIFLFPNQRGGQMAISNFERHWRGGLARRYTTKSGEARESRIMGMRQKAGLLPKVKFHWLRHTCATRLMEIGTPEEIRNAILGHEARGISQRYAHGTEAAMRRALEEYERVLWEMAA